jgi:hydroxyproline transporter system substrate-binding protein
MTILHRLGPLILPQLNGSTAVANQTAGRSAFLLTAKKGGNKTMNILKFLAGLALVAAIAQPAYADKLDDIIASGKLRCAIVLDFPPMGSRDSNNSPIGFDVDTCNDLAKALGVTPEYVETPFPDRIPALVSGRADVGVASTSDTLERAKTIGFSIPYFAFTFNVITRKDVGIDSYESLKGHKVGSVSGTFEAIRLEEDVKKWADPAGSFQAFQTQADVFLALSQGSIDATAVTSTVAYATAKDPNFANLVVGGEAPYPIDYVSLIGLREEYGFLNYLNLFVNQQIRTGRYTELYNKWIAPGDAPNLLIPGAYY